MRNAGNHIAAAARCCSPCLKGRNRAGERGSVLIMVLWILALIAMLAGEYMAHNRGKANLAINAVSRLELDGDVKSVLALLKEVSFEPPAALGAQGEWIELSPGKRPIFVKVEKGENVVNLNSAEDNVIREKIRKMLGEDLSMEADSIADAILDWRDDNDLVRANGAEKDYYESEGLGYIPSDGPFKALTELLMVKGVSRELFWGNPVDLLPDREEDDGSIGIKEKKVFPGEKDTKEEDKEELSEESTSLSRAFSIHTDKTKRVSIIAGCGDDCYAYLLLFLEKEGKSWRPLTLHRTIITGSRAEEE